MIDTCISSLPAGGVVVIIEVMGFPLREVALWGPGTIVIEKLPLRLYVIQSLKLDMKLAKRESPQARGSHPHHFIQRWATRASWLLLFIHSWWCAFIAQSHAFWRVKGTWRINVDTSRLLKDTFSRSSRGEKRNWLDLRLIHSKLYSEDRWENIHGVVLYSSAANEDIRKFECCWRRIQELRHWL